MHEPQSDAELQVQYGPEGPVAAAREFMEALVQREQFEAAWELLDVEFQLWLAQAWAWANRTHPLVATLGVEPEDIPRALVAQRVAHPLWHAFAATTMTELLKAFSDVDLAEWGWASRPRPVGPGLELVRLVDAGGDAVIDRAMELQGVQFVMRHDGRWRVCNINDEQPVRTGWPPDTQ